MRGRPVLLAGVLLSLAPAEPDGTVSRLGDLRGKVVPLFVDRKSDVTGVGYGVFGPPTAYPIDRQGRLVAPVVGERDWSTPWRKTCSSRR